MNATVNRLLDYAPDKTDFSDKDEKLIAPYVYINGVHYLNEIPNLEINNIFEWFVLNKLYLQESVTIGVNEAFIRQTGKATGRLEIIRRLYYNNLITFITQPVGKITLINGNL